MGYRKLNYLLLLALVSMCIGGAAQTGGLKKGAKAPLFEAMDAKGIRYNLSDLLKQGPVVLVFYRGYWCPFCNRHLSELQQALPAIKAKGARLIAITPEKPDFIEKTIDKTNAGFPLLHDADLSIINAYQVAFPLKDDVLNRYKNAGIDLQTINGNKGNILPVPALYIVNQEGVIVYSFYDPNYRNRAPVAEILSKIP
ncbi:MAG TPA: peroxiredoxin-like family protein [Phnomibacter sp.]|nr:peroxiredoxin-like family protein [Phnomibacter sp.]